jgi:hypothetical protein
MNQSHKAGLGDERATSLGFNMAIILLALAVATHELP